ncbi:unnamed protein product [Didymodactylos carnosus]|uniref:Uncharacterized protein n=1 Tax=Didymodactylos carnosus TaxID=1234261 RepID=A0A814ZAF3_9BILA|nr:unnamed protein product [Didymodactylos carnosus]CAF1460601.1 unnamed protein product [Didymodactylos carnosus]CAF4002590.1 unnamed protein product [Didymodactylos carnosus]CAF4253862.1 unnamed protein product [Didymodactylos carnosus]
MTNYLDSYKSIFLDITLKDFWTVFSIIHNENNLQERDKCINELIYFWSRHASCPRHSPVSFYLPVLCVRTGFDLFLRLNNFPSNSQIIMSAVNIPSMITLVQYHKLTVVPCDIDRTSTGSSVENVEKLITHKTVAIVFAHIYGRCYDVSKLIDLADKYNLYFIEDCAECFSGFCSCNVQMQNQSDNKITNNNQIQLLTSHRYYPTNLYCHTRLSSADTEIKTDDNQLENQKLCYLGHPRSHLVMFSFGVLKFCTALGGGLVKISNYDLYMRMKTLYENDPVQITEQYYLNVKKYFYLYWLLNIPHIIKPLMYIVRYFQINHMEYAIERLRAFSKTQSTEQVFSYIRRQPCKALLVFLLKRFQSYDYELIDIQREKALYVLRHLNESNSLKFVGMNASVRNFWLFPIIVQKPDLFVRLLSKSHIDAYRGTTQLNVATKQLTGTSIVLPSSNDSVPTNISEQQIYSCPKAENLIDHVIYLPVNRLVPYNVLDQLINVVNNIAKQIDQYAIKSKL